MRLKFANRRAAFRGMLACALALLSAVPAVSDDLTQQVSTDSLRTTVRALADAGGYRSRVTFTPGNDISAGYIKQRFDNIPGLTSVAQDTFFVTADVPYDTKPLFNIVATLEGKTRPGDVLLLGAHYDASASRMAGTTWNDQWRTIRAPGADDNATGVACILEIARILADPSSGFARDITLKFVAFASEESGPVHSGGHGGSRHYAGEAWTNGENIVGMLSIDMIGYNASRYYTAIVSDSPSTWLGDRFRAALDSAGVALETNLRPYPTATYSDHDQFWANGYPAILLIEHAPPWTSSSVYTANPFYHKTSDTLGTLNMELVRRVTQGVLAMTVSMGGGIVTGVADGAEQPNRMELFQNYPNPFNPTTGIRYQVSGVSDVKLVVYDLLGREVAVLVNERKAPGSYQVQFNAANLATGVYVYRLTAGSTVLTRKMTLLR